MKPIQLIILLVLSFHMASCNMKPKEAKNVELTLIEDAETRDFINFWKEFSLKFKLSDTAFIKKVAMDTVWLWNKGISSTDFFEQYFLDYLDSRLQQTILDTNKTRYGWIGCYSGEIIKDASRSWDERAEKYKDDYDCVQAIVEDTVGSNVNAYQFSFLKSTSGYRLSSLTSYTYSWPSRNKMVDTTAVSEQ